MLTKKLFIALLAGVLLPSVGVAGDATLRGSKSAMERQNRVAKENDFTFLRTPAQIRAFVLEGRLAPLYGNRDYEVDGVSFPYARPEVTLFVERLGAQHRAACGQKLVVTSATRPATRQPRNSSPLSVHPAGMAVDLRVPSSGACRSWLEGTLLSLEEQNLLDVTRERHPPHYHVAIFTHVYAAHVEAMLADSLAAAIDAERARAAAALAARAAKPVPQPVMVATVTPGPVGRITAPWLVLLLVLAFTAVAPLVVALLRGETIRQAAAREPELG